MEREKWPSGVRVPSVGGVGGVAVSTGAVQQLLEVSGSGCGIWIGTYV